MCISRTGQCPIFLKYITEQALIPRARQPSADFVELTRYNFHWIDVPSFQRGLVWSEDLLEELLASRSVFLGNAILGSFPADRSLPAFSKLPESASDYEVLIDGLQRFSIGTALLSILFPLVLSDTPERGDDAGHFTSLRMQAGIWGPVYQHNDFELKNHQRRAVADSYQAFRKRLQTWIVGRFDRGEATSLGVETIQLFLQRQIAPDVYHGFSSVYEVASTFIGLNTVRVQLNIVDWLRSVIVDQGGQAGWSPDVIEDLENRFSSTFNRDSGVGPEAELVPLASILKEILTEGTAEEKRRVFPSWGSGFIVEEVEQLLDFVEQVSDHDGNPFVREIRLCGAIPFAALILNFYRCQLMEGEEPAFLKGGDSDDPALLQFLRAYYRVVFEGRVARTREYAKRLLLADEKLGEVADRLSRNFIGKPLEERVDRDWLVATLKSADSKRARQIFNACLLPEHNTGSSFHPHRFGRNAEDYQIDHMIPASILEPHQAGGPEGQLLMNFAPIRKTTNVKQLNIACSHKLAEGGVYQMECINNSDTHPYLRWLLENQGPEGSLLDVQELLQTAASPNLAAQRIEWIADRLLSRI
jgi:hypothetical protein